jgi:hypothetical protein
MFDLRLCGHWVGRIERQAVVEIERFPAANRFPLPEHARRLPQPNMKKP